MIASQLLLVFSLIYIGFVWASRRDCCSAESVLRCAFEVERSRCTSKHRQYPETVRLFVARKFNWSDLIRGGSEIWIPWRMGGNEATKYTRGLTHRLKLGYGAFPNRFFRFNIFLRGVTYYLYKVKSIYQRSCSSENTCRIFERKNHEDKRKRSVDP